MHLKPKAKYVVTMLMTLSTIVSLLVGVVALASSQSSENVVYAGAVKVHRFTYGNLTIYVVYPNTEPIYVYRNAYVVRYDWKQVFYMPYAPPKQEVFTNRIELVKQKLGSMGASIVNLDPHGVIYVDSLRDEEKVNEILRAVGEYFKDQHATIVIYDLNLKNLHDRVGDAVESARSKIGFGWDDIYWLNLNELDIGKSRLIEFICSSGVAWSPGGGWSRIGSIALVNTRLYELPANASNWVEQNIRRCVDSWRRYISEDIPLYIYLYEEFPLLQALPAIQSITTTTPPQTTTISTPSVITASLSSASTTFIQTAPSTTTTLVTAVISSVTTLIVIAVASVAIISISVLLKGRR
jgi:hypothetical protein